MDAAAQKLLRARHLADLFGQHVHEFAHRIRSSVGQSPFQEAPNSLIRVQLRGMGRKGDEIKSRRPLQEFLHRLAPMRVEIIQKNDQRAGDLAQEMTEECGHFFPLDVLLIQMTVQRASKALMTDGNPGNGRDAVMAITMTDERRAPDRTPRFPHGRDQEEARFVEEDNMGCQPRGVFFTLGQTDRFHSAMAASSRSTALLSGFWWLQPIWRRSLPT